MADAITQTNPFRTYELHPRNDWLAKCDRMAIRLMGDDKALDTAGPTAVRMALEAGDLVLRDADVRGADGDCLVALMSARDHAIFDAADPYLSRSNAALHPSLQALALALVEQGCDPQRRWDKANGLDPIDMALMANAPQLVRAWAPKVDWQTRRMDGLGWLAASARAGNADMIRTLVDIGGEVNYQDEAGNSALFYASTKDAVLALLAAGADGALRNHQGVDAASYWKGARNLRGAKLEELERALGKARANPEDLSEEGRVRAFFDISAGQAPGIVLKQAKRLKIEGGERIDGRGLLAVAAERLRKTPTYPQGKHTQASSWMIQVLQWPQAVAAATDEELSHACLVCMLEGPDTLVGRVRKELQQRGHTDQTIKARLAERAGEMAKGMSTVELHNEGMVLLDIISDGPAGFLQQHGEIVARIGNSISGWKSDHNDMAERVAKRLLGETQGWDHPELLMGLLRLGPGYSASPMGGGVEVLAGRVQMANAVAHGLGHGAVWTDACQQLADRRKTTRQGIAEADLWRVIEAAVEQQALERATASPGVSKRRGGPRL